METAPFHAPGSQRQSLDEWILDDPEASFLMRMEGDSMRDYGIYHDDMLVIERAAEAKANDLVVVVRDGSWAIDSYKNVAESEESQTIQAVIRAVIRKYE